MNCSSLSIVSLLLNIVSAFNFIWFQASKQKFRDSLCFLRFHLCPYKHTRLRLVLTITVYSSAIFTLLCYSNPGLAGCSESETSNAMLTIKTQVWNLERVKSQISSGWNWTGIGIDLAENNNGVKEIRSGCTMDMDDVKLSFLGAWSIHYSVSVSRLRLGAWQCYCSCCGNSMHEVAMEFLIGSRLLWSPDTNGWITWNEWVQVQRANKWNINPTSKLAFCGIARATFSLWSSYCFLLATVMFHVF